MYLALAVDTPDGTAPIATRQFRVSGHPEMMLAMRQEVARFQAMCVELVPTEGTDTAVFVTRRGKGG